MIKTPCLRSFFALLACLLLTCQASGQQKSPIYKTDQKLTRLHSKLWEGDWEKTWDTYAPRFETELVKALLNPLTFTYTLDSLSKPLSILGTSDQRLKLYSWDVPAGGSSHFFTSWAQFRSPTGAMVAAPLMNENEYEYTNCLLYEVNEFRVKGQTYYLTFGWGTFGDGLQHQTVQAFYLNGDSIVKHKGCFTDGIDPVFEFPRAASFHITFDPSGPSIIHDHIATWEEDHYAGIPKQAQDTLRLVDGVFVKE